jgi:hypothetical protein
MPIPFIEEDRPVVRLAKVGDPGLEISTIASLLLPDPPCVVM